MRTSDLIDDQGAINTEAEVRARMRAFKANHKPDSQTHFLEHAEDDIDFLLKEHMQLSDKIVILKTVIEHLAA